ncbi:MAG: nicotinate (nicotinamide) nucleotide adenylyltransferase [Brachymonas sp.]|nr:nicotinate (nicotinamide) nucleotide adenylyltransferase [Brachymonas sp.]
MTTREPVREPLRIGVYGGAFDPPHLAHEALARAAVEQHQLDRLIILPTGQAWHKSRALSDAQHRLALARLGFADLPQAQIDPRETLRNGPTYTIDTLHELRSEHLSTQLFLLMGQDQLAFFPQWHRYQEVLQIATLLVALRAYSMPASSQKGLKNEVKIPHLTIAMPAMPISATDIRQRVQSGLGMDHLVKPLVARYIADHSLYFSR